VTAFRAAVAEGRHEDAVALYRGDFLDGVFLHDTIEYERWLDLERSRIRADAARAARQMALRHEQDGNLEKAIEEFRRSLALAADEPTLRRLLDLLDRTGDRLGAVHSYDTFAREAAEYGTEPSAETRAAIEYIRRRPSATVATLLVLPVTNLSGDPELDYLADGITDQLIGDLSRQPGLRVIGRTSVLKFVAGGGGTHTAARDLSVRYSVETSLTTNHPLVIEVRLFEAVGVRELLRESIRGDVKAVFPVQEQMLETILRGLAMPEKRSLSDPRRSDRDARAYDCYLRARSHLLRYEPREIERGLQVLRYGLREDVHSPLLHAALGTVDFTMVFSGADPSEARLRSAEEHAAVATRSDQDALHTHLLQASIAWARGRVTEAIRHYHRSLELDPNHPEALLHLANIYAHAGKDAASRHFIGRLFAIDPLSGVNYSVTGALALYEGHFEEATNGPYRTALETDPCPPAVMLYALGLARCGDIAQAVALLDQLPQSSPGPGLTDLATFLRYALAGDRQATLEAVTPLLESYAGFVFHHAWQLGAGFAIVGELERACSWMKRAATLGFVHYPFLLVDPLLENLRQDRRWNQLAEDFRHRWEEFGSSPVTQGAL
jgi:TolB-like protein/Flp pilus assembly protein TadD